MMPLDFTRMRELFEELRAAVIRTKEPIVICAQRSGVQCGGCADDAPPVQVTADAFDEPCPYGECNPFGGAIIIVRLPHVLPEPRNNDGRSHCWWCWSWTEKRQGFTAEYDVCPKCGK